MAKMVTAGLMALTLLMACGKDKEGTPKPLFKNDEKPGKVERNRGLEGMWKSRCVEVGGGRFRFETMTFTETTFSEVTEIHSTSDCSASTLTLSRSGTYKLGADEEAEAVHPGFPLAPPKLGARHIEFNIEAPSAFVGIHRKLFYIEKEALFFGDSSPDLKKETSKIYLRSHFARIP